MTDSTQCTDIVNTICSENGIDFELYEEQKQAIFSIFKGQKTSVVCLPTGYGKSLICFIGGEAVLNNEGGNCLIVIITPTLALTSDLLASANQYNFNAVNLKFCTNQNSDGIHFYIGTPESFISNYQMLKRRVKRIVFDEAHLLFEWGRTFRKSYDETIDIILQYFHKVHISFISATLTKQILRELTYMFGKKYKNCEIFAKRSVRYEIDLLIETIYSDEALQNLKITDQKTLIICSTVKLANHLKDIYPNCDIDTSKHSEQHSQSILDTFPKGSKSLITTVRWLQGINCQNLTNVMYIGFPKSIATITQFEGRVARTKLSCGTAKIILRNEDLRDLITNTMIDINKRYRTFKLPAGQILNELDSIINTIKVLFTHKCIKLMASNEFNLKKQNTNAEEKCDNCTVCINSNQLDIVAFNTWLNGIQWCLQTFNNFDVKHLKSKTDPTSLTFYDLLSQDRSRKFKKKTTYYSNTWNNIRIYAACLSLGFFEETPTKAKQPLLFGIYKLSKNGRRVMKLSSDKRTNKVDKNLIKHIKDYLKIPIILEEKIVKKQGKRSIWKSFIKILETEIERTSKIELPWLSTEAIKQLYYGTPDTSIGGLINWLKGIVNDRYVSLLSHEEWKAVVTKARQPIQAYEAKQQDAIKRKQFKLERKQQRESEKELRKKKKKKKRGKDAQKAKVRITKQMRQKAAQATKEREQLQHLLDEQKQQNELREKRLANRQTNRPTRTNFGKIDYNKLAFMK